MTLSDSIQQAKGKLPLPELMRQLGDEQYAKRSARSPFRNGDNKHCFGIFQKGDGGHNWKDQVTGEFGDEIDYIAHRFGMSKDEATAEFLKLAGVERTEQNLKLKAALNGHTPTIVTQHFDWSACVAEASDQIEHIAEWRGLSLEFMRAFHSTASIGWYDGGVAFPIHDESGKAMGCHYRNESGVWFFTKGCRVAPFTIGNTATAQTIFLFESQWDAMAFADRTGWHEWEKDDEFAFVATRGAANGRLAAPFARQGVSLVLVPQNDKPDPKSGKVAAEEWVKSVTEAVNGHPLTRLAIPKEHKDANDWVRAGATGAAIFDAMASARRVRKSTLSIRSVMELITMGFDDADNYFGDRVIAAGQPVTLLGPGGVGKSRLVLQLALCMITGREFLGIETRAVGKRWLIIQTENSNRRLKADLINLWKHFKFKDHEARAINDCLTIHTMESDRDGFLDLSDPEAIKEISGLIHDTTPDIVVFDPLNTFTSADLNSDRDMRAVVAEISRITTAGNPDRVPFVVHHSLTGKHGAARAVGWDKASYGRNSKVLQAWTRAQINIGPQDPEDPKTLIMACGKNNNGKLFPDMGVLYDEGKGVYIIDPEFNATEYREAVGLEKAGPKKIAISPVQVAELFDKNCDKKQLVKRVMDAFGCAQRRAYQAVDDAESAKAIVRRRGEKWNPIFEKPTQQTSLDEPEND